MANETATKGAGNPGCRKARLYCNILARHTGDLAADFNNGKPSGSLHTYGDDTEATVTENPYFLSDDHTFYIGKRQYTVKQIFNNDII